MKSEEEVSQAIRVAAPYNNISLWRNNVGCAFTKQGRPIRYGLCNDSKQLNQKFKSSDLIGITQVTITPDMVGRTVAVFTSIEVKEEGWKYSGKGRELAQNNWLHLINQLGGYGYFAQSVRDLGWTS